MTIESPQNKQQSTTPLSNRQSEYLQSKIDSQITNVNECTGNPPRNRNADARPSSQNNLQRNRPVPSQVLFHVVFATFLSPPHGAVFEPLRQEVRNSNPVDTTHAYRRKVWKYQKAALASLKEASVGDALQRLLWRGCIRERWTRGARWLRIAICGVD